MNNYNVVANDFNKEITVPTSKSYANRLLILAAIDKRDIMLSGLPNSTDVLTMIDCLKNIGLNIVENSTGLVVKGSFPECEKSSNGTIKLMTGDGGTTNRFILSLLARGKNNYELIPKGHMVNRPMRPLISALESLDVTVKQSQNYWIQVKGPMTKDSVVTIDCLDSTQFATSILLSTCDLNIKIDLQNLKSSKKYFDLTVDLIDKFKKQQLDYIVPVDFSSLSYPLALAAYDGRVKVTNCFEVDEFQADSVFVDILKQMGAIVKLDDEGLICESSLLSGVKVDGGQCPDVVPTIAFLAAYANSETLIRNIDVLRHKECDRVTELLKILDTFSVSYELRENDLLIRGNSKLKKCQSLLVPDDHRMVMVGYLFLRVNGGGAINNANHVNKSFPKFYNTMI